MADVLARFAFRAKSKKKPTEWVYGNYIEVKREKIILHHVLGVGLTVVPCEILQDTLGQWTGLFDKNKKRIWEDDIITHPCFNKLNSRCRSKRADVLCLVKWDPGFDHSPAHLENNPDMKANPSLFSTHPQFVAHVIDHKATGADWGYNWSEFHDCEVVGNKIDNPEYAGK